MANDNAGFDISSLLDGTLDQLADLPEFKPFPAGTHRVVCTMVDKTGKKDWVNGHPGFEMKLKAVETIELANPDEDAPLIPGAETSVLYLLDNEMGQGKFKKIMASFAEKFGNQPIRSLVAEVKNIEVVMITSQRSNKDKTAVYTDIVELMVE